MKLKRHKINFLKQTVKPEYLETYIYAIESRGVSKSVLIRYVIIPEHSICGDWVNLYIGYDDFEKEQ